MKLIKELNLVDVFCIASGAMISSGLFILPGLAHSKASPAVVLSYFIAGLLALTGMLSQAELVSAMPKSGGTYFYVTRSMGSAAGTVNGLITWISLCFKTAFALIGMAAFAKIIINLDIKIIALLLCFLFTAINLISIKKAGRMQDILVFGLFAILLLYIIRGLSAINIHNFEPFVPKGLTSIFSTAGFVFISYGGLINVASIAEEVKNPSRTIPLGMLLSLFITSIFYTLVVFITSGVLGAAELDHSLTPISDGAFSFMGQSGLILLSIAAVLAFISTANAGIMAASRYPLALSKDELLPQFLGKINKTFKTPHSSILLTGFFTTAFLFLKLDIFVKIASTVLLLTFLFSCLSVIIMRESNLQNYDPQFKSPLYPWVQLIGIIGFSYLIFEMGKAALWASSILISGGFFIYWFYGRIRTTREYALLHLIQRITAKELTTHSLETELKKIIRERDDIIRDRFDKIIEECIVLDLDQNLILEKFFQYVSKVMSERLKVNQSVLFKLLLDREKDSSTEIQPGIAIPHIIIEGENCFDILMCRSKQGIIFSKNLPKVHTIFILIGTKDERNFHLRALAAIAQIIQDHNFHKKWMAAKSKEVLRDIVLLGQRVRKNVLK